jgi:hypothetical protein
MVGGGKAREGGGAFEQREEKKGGRRCSCSCSCSGAFRGLLLSSSIWMCEPQVYPPGHQSRLPRPSCPSSRSSSQSSSDEFPPKHAPMADATPTPTPTPREHPSQQRSALAHVCSSAQVLYNSLPHPHLDLSRKSVWRASRTHRREVEACVSERQAVTRRTIWPAGDSTDCPLTRTPPLRRGSMGARARFESCRRA